MIINKGSFQLTSADKNCDDLEYVPDDSSWRGLLLQRGREGEACSRSLMRNDFLGKDITLNHDNFSLFGAETIISMK